ncbi:MAG: RNA polymerase sigma factor [Acidobacteriia bacterium]|nr:RNA polymerase sigma factor [Terriglobia bacterium]
MEGDDESLLAAIRDGSDSAFNTLIDRHQQAVRTFLRGLTANPSDADDLAQETFLAAWTQAKSFRGQGSVRSWLFSIAWRKAKGSQRRWFRAARRDTAYHESLPGEGAPEAPAEDRIAMRQALLSLPLDQRAAVTLVLGSGYTHEEAAKMLAIPLGTIKSHVLRGREKLRPILGDRS